MEVVRDDHEEGATRFPLNGGGDEQPPQPPAAPADEAEKLWDEIKDEPTEGARKIVEESVARFMEVHYGKKRRRPQMNRTETRDPRDVDVRDRTVRDAVPDRPRRDARRRTAPVRASRRVRRARRSRATRRS